VGFRRGLKREVIVEAALEQTLEMIPFAQGVEETALEQTLEMTPFAQGVEENELEQRLS
jgi:hypothetical protein